MAAITVRRRFYGGPLDGKVAEIVLTATGLGYGSDHASPPVVYLARESQHPSLGVGRLRAVPPPDHVLELHPYHLRQLHTEGADGEGFRFVVYVHQVLLDTWEDKRGRIVTDWLTEQLLANRPDANGDVLYLPHPGGGDGPA